MALNLGTTGIISGSNIKIDNASDSIALTHITASGNISSSGTIIAAELTASSIRGDFVEISSSVIFSSGSNIFGADSDDTHEFTGSFSVSGSSKFFNSTQFMTESRFAGGLWIDATQKIIFDGWNGNGDQWIMGADSNISFNGDNYLNFYADNTSNFSEGNVAIGYAANSQHFGNTDVSGLVVKGPISGSDTGSAMYGHFNKRLMVGNNLATIYDLDVNTTSWLGRTNSMIRACGNDIARLSLQNGSKHYSLSTQGNNLYFFDETASVTRMMLDTVGRFAIGHTNPSSPLHVSKSYTGTQNTILTLSTEQTSDFNNQFEGNQIEMTHKDNGGAELKGILALRQNSGNYNANDGSQPWQEKSSAFHFYLNDLSGSLNTSWDAVPAMLVTANGVGINTNYWYTGSIFNTYGGGVVFDAGTSVPNFSPDNDGNTHNWAQFKSFGNNDLCISSSVDGRKIGIGSADNPSELLHMGDTGLYGTYLKIDSYGGGNKAGIKLLRYGGSEYRIENDNSNFKINHLSSAGSLSNRLLMKSDGNIGINNTNPPEKLSVGGHITASGFISADYFRAGDGKFYGPGGIGDAELLLSSNATILNYLNQQKLRLDGSDISLSTDNVVRFILKGTTGNVGIGNNAPQQKLTVDGNISASGFIQVGNMDPSHVAVGNLRVKSDSNHKAISIEENNGPEAYHMGVNNGGNFQIYNSGNANPNFVISDGNHVGINVPEPSRELEVLGNISASGYIYGQSGRVVPTIKGAVEANRVALFTNDTAGNPYSINSAATLKYGLDGLEAFAFTSSRVITNIIQSDTGSNLILATPFGNNKKILLNPHGPTGAPSDTGQVEVGMWSASFSRITYFKEGITGSSDIRFGGTAPMLELTTNYHNDVDDKVTVRNNYGMAEFKNWSAHNDAGLALRTQNMHHGVVLNNQYKTVGIGQNASNIGSSGNIFGNPYYQLQVAGGISSSGDLAIGYQQSGDWAGSPILSTLSSGQGSIQARGDIIQSLGYSASLGYIFLGDITEHKTRFIFKSTTSTGAYNSGGGLIFQSAQADSSKEALVIKASNHDGIFIGPGATDTTIATIGDQFLTLQGPGGAETKVKVGLHTMFTGSKSILGIVPSSMATYQLDNAADVTIQGNLNISDYTASAGQIRGGILTNRRNPIGQHYSMPYIVASGSLGTDNSWKTDYIPIIKEGMPNDLGGTTPPSLQSDGTLRMANDQHTNNKGLFVDAHISSSGIIIAGSGSCTAVSNQQRVGVVNAYSKATSNPSECGNTPGRGSNHNFFAFNKERGGTAGSYGGSIGFGGQTTYSTERCHAAIAVKATHASDVDYAGLAFFTHDDVGSYSSDNTEQMVLTHNGHLILNNGGIQANGTISASLDVIAYYTSDERLKYNVETIRNPIEKISKLRGVRYNWGSNQDIYPEGQSDTGIIAQDVQKVLPEIVHQRKNGHLAVKHDRLVGLLIEAVKEQQGQIDELKQEVKKLKGDE